MLLAAWLDAAGVCALLGTWLDAAGRAALLVGGSRSELLVAD